MDETAVEAVHELSVMSYMLEAVVERATQLDAKKVVGINLVIGERASIVDDSLLFCFELLASDTIAAGARVNIRRTHMRFHCEPCAEDYARVGDDFCCPRCKTIGQVTNAGTELLIDSIEIDR